MRSSLARMMTRCVYMMKPLNAPTTQFPDTVCQRYFILSPGRVSVKYMLPVALYRQRLHSLTIARKPDFHRGPQYRSSNANRG